MRPTAGRPIACLQLDLSNWWVFGRQWRSLCFFYLWMSHHGRQTIRDVTYQKTLPLSLIIILGAFSSSLHVTNKKKCSRFRYCHRFSPMRQIRDSWYSLDRLQTPIVTIQQWNPRKQHHRKPTRSEFGISVCSRFWLYLLKYPSILVTVKYGVTKGVTAIVARYLKAVNVKSSVTGTVIGTLLPY